jgi:hypothetical protein
MGRWRYPSWERGGYLQELIAKGRVFYSTLDKTCHIFLSRGTTIVLGPLPKLQHTRRASNKIGLCNIAQRLFGE